MSHDHSAYESPLWLLLILYWSIQTVMGVIVDTHQVAYADLHHPPVRCWGDSESREMFDHRDSLSPREVFDRLSQTQCNICDPHRKHRRDHQGSDDRYHAVLIYQGNAPEFISLATGLLLTNLFRITVLEIHFETDEENMDKDKDKPPLETKDKVVGRIQKKIMSGLPCDHPVRMVEDACYVLKVNFSIKEQNHGDDDHCQGPFVLQPFNTCAINVALGTARLIENYVPLADLKTPLEQKLPDVMITDASIIGGLWMSELWKVPTVAVGGPALISLAVEHDAAWTSQTGSWLKRIGKLLKQRFHSLSITLPYMKMNKMRSEFGLPRLRKPIDYLVPVVALLMEFAPSDSIPRSDSEIARDVAPKMPYEWERIHVVGPLQPPCVPCEVKPKSPPTSLRAAFRDKQSFIPKTHTKEPTILVVPPTKLTALWTRNILQALIMVRDSLERYDDCDWDSLTCQKPSANLKIIWLAEEDSKEDFFPIAILEFVERETYISLLDSLANHPGTMLVVMPCDKHTVLLEDALGIPTVCLEASDRFPLRTYQKPPIPSEPRALTAKVLQRLRDRQQKEQRIATATNKGQHISANGSLTEAVSIIQLVASVHRENQPWEDISEMQRVTLQAVKNRTQRLHDVRSSKSTSIEDELDWQPPYDTFTVLVAWIVLLVSVAYVTCRDMFSSRTVRRSHINYNHHYSSSSSSSTSLDGLFTRPDLDDAWIALLDWYHAQPDSLQQLYKNLMGDNMSPSGPPWQGNVESSRPNVAATPDQGQNNRRRKKR